MSAEVIRSKIVSRALVRVAIISVAFFPTLVVYAELYARTVLNFCKNRIFHFLLLFFFFFVFVDMGAHGSTTLPTNCSRTISGILNPDMVNDIWNIAKPETRNDPEDS